MNEPERVTVKATRDEAINLLEERGKEMNVEMHILYKASSILRKAIGKAETWTFTGSFSDSTNAHVPEELYIFYRWVIQGPKTTLSTDKKNFIVNKHATSLAQLVHFRKEGWPGCLGFAGQRLLPRGCSSAANWFLQCHGNHAELVSASGLERSEPAQRPSGITSRPRAAR